MQIIHHLGILTVRKKIEEDAGFLLTNKMGGYCSFFNLPSSRYRGLFFFEPKSMKMYRFVESIEIYGNPDVELLRNGFYYAERKKNHASEKFFFLKNSNSLLYELDGNHDIDIILDCKESYDNREWGRFYEISDDDGTIVVKFTKKTDSREDATSGQKEFELHLAIKCDTGKYVKNDRWIERNYFSDWERNSPPSARHVYNALRLRGNKFVFSMSASRKDAVQECNLAFANSEALKKAEKENFFAMLRNEPVKKVITGNNISGEIKIAYINALNSLNNLAVRAKTSEGIMAGLPWFFQFWSRDALISIKGLSIFNKPLAQKLILDYSGKISDDGRLHNIAGQLPGQIGSADADGWLFLRANEMLKAANDNNAIIKSIKESIAAISKNENSSSQKIKEYIGRCSSAIHKKESESQNFISEIKNSLDRSINGLLLSHTKYSFAQDNPKETWMDTDFGGDSRAGARIEIQALRLNMYRMMFDITNNHKYSVLENVLHTSARNKFWNGKILADGSDDFTVRPNVFIASYAYPSLLAQKEWETCFENSLNALWLDWGGLSTIDRKNKLFIDSNTGEGHQSYHRGDSWFWLNNLAAIEMSRINKKKFEKYVKKMIAASAEDILWKGCIGCASELSSAKELTSAGCFSQAWSNAMFVEMIGEVFG